MMLLVCKGLMYLNQMIANSSNGQDCSEDGLVASHTQSGCEVFHQTFSIINHDR